MASDEYTRIQLRDTQDALEVQCARASTAERDLAELRAKHEAVLARVREYVCRVRGTCEAKNIREAVAEAFADEGGKGGADA